MACIAALTALACQAAVPHLQRQGNTEQLIVGDAPFLVLGGELGNSSSSSARYMAPHWPRLKQMHLNTVLAPVSCKSEQNTVTHGGLIIRTGPEDYLVAGQGMIVTFAPVGPGPPLAGIDTCGKGRSTLTARGSPGACSMAIKRTRGAICAWLPVTFRSSAYVCIAMSEAGPGARPAFISG